ncbi:progestin and adipoQ receptor family member IX [Columba livia]|uniref:Progestin and adipoQ receptor family member IX n=1 Tax=Columba livia TaxID=8932 RepID=A0A2I0MBI4_COLLI|nr:progestin and adipoQ receptor family member IX [Columba livia]
MGPECVPGGKVSAGLGLGRTASAVQLQGAAPRPFCTALSISTGTEQCMVMQFGGLHLNLARSRQGGAGWSAEATPQTCENEQPVGSRSEGEASPSKPGNGDEPVRAAARTRPTNETLNFWTHFIPLLLFLSRFGQLLLLRGAGDVPFHHPALLPLWCYASGVLLTFAMSCTAHLFSCLSPRLRAAFFYLDYASISYYGFASTVAYSYYLLPGLSLLDSSAMSRYPCCLLRLPFCCAHLRLRHAAEHGLPHHAGEPPL